MAPSSALSTRSPRSAVRVGGGGGGEGGGGEGREGEGGGEVECGAIDIAVHVYTWQQNMYIYAKLLDACI